MTRIAAAAAPYGHDAQAGLASIERDVRAARDQGAELVVFPETAIGGYLLEPMPGEHAPVLPTPIDLDGPEIARLIDIAGKTVVCAGFTESRGPGEKPYSTAVCVSGAGIHGIHRKVHLPPGERFAYAAGDRFEAFDTPVGRMGMLLCYDKLFPEAARALALDGAQLVASMAAWPACRQRPAPRLQDDRQTRHFNLTDEARAIENQVVWISSNQSGTLGPLNFLGNAKVVDPDGVVLATTGCEAGLAIADIAINAAVIDARIGIDHLGDRRPAAYGPAAVAAFGARQAG